MRRRPGNGKETAASGNLNEALPGSDSATPAHGSPAPPAALYPRRSFDKARAAVIAFGVFVFFLAALAMYAYPRHRVRKNVARAQADLRTIATGIESYWVHHSIYPAWEAGPPKKEGVWSHNWKTAQATGNRSGVADLPSFASTSLPYGEGGFCTLTRDKAHVGGKGYMPDPMPTTMTVWTAKGEKVVNVGDTFGYFDVYPVDPFCKDRGATYVFWSLFPGAVQPSETPVGGIGWMLVSPGPDGDYDIAGDYHVYDPSKPQPSPPLLAGTNSKGSAFTYDPTNGLYSDGDIWRVKQ